jgi:hypothetical protein
MDAALLWRKYPRVYHMAHLGSWPSIHRHGLLSTSALLDLFEVPAEERVPIETQRRGDSVTIHHPIYRTAVVRDQKPLSPTRLAKCLAGISVVEWFRLLNNRVFFWAEEKRLNVLRGAEAYRLHRQTVLTVDTRPLVEAYGPQILLAHMNTGATRPFAHPRGAETFRSIAEYPFTERRRVVELTVDKGVPDIQRFVIQVDELGGDEAGRTIWPKG